MRRFSLVRYFSWLGLAAVVLVGLIVIYMEHQHASFFQSVQQSKSESFKKIQSDHTARVEQVATRDLVRIYEGGHENLTKVLSNVLWQRDLAPYVAKVETLGASGCRLKSTPEQQKTCYRAYGQSLMKLPGFAALDQHVYATMKSTNVFKVKVYDLRGITVYSSEHNQIGEDKSGNDGWKSAVGGKPASEISHRDKFSAFEGIVADRDLISSYFPILDSAGVQVVGVFEIYSDVTPFLKQIKATSAEFRQLAAANNAQQLREDEAHVEEVNHGGWLQVVMVAGMLAVLYVVLLRVVMNAQKIMDAQEQAADEHKRRQAKADKANSMTQLVEGLINQLKIPMSGIKTNLIEVREAVQTVHHVDDAWRQAVTTEIEGCELAAQQAADLINGLRTFGQQNKGVLAEVDVNAWVAGVAQVARVVTPPRIQIVEDYHPTPRIECNTSQLSQALLNILLNAAQAIEAAGRIKVVTGVEGGEIRITIKDSGTGIPPDMLPMIFEPYFTTKDVSHDGGVNGLGLSIAKDIVEQHGGRILVHSVVGKGSAFAICLPLRTKAQ